MSRGEKKSNPSSNRKHTFLNSGCCPYTEIRWKLKGKYLCPIRTNLSFENNRQLLGKVVEAWTGHSPAREIPREISLNKELHYGVVGTCWPKVFLHYDHLKERWSWGAPWLVFGTTHNSSSIWYWMQIHCYLLGAHGPLKDRNTEVVLLTMAQGAQAKVNTEPRSSRSQLTISAKAIFSSHHLFPKSDCSFHLHRLPCSLVILSPCWPLPLLPWPSSLPSERRLSRYGCNT